MRPASRKSYQRLGIALSVIMLVSPAAAQAAAVGGGTTKAPAGSGTAKATSTLIEITTGAGAAKLAADDALSVRGKSPRAFAQLIGGVAGGKQVGAAEKTSTRSGEQQRASLAQESLSIQSLLDFEIAKAGVATYVGDTVTSSVDVQLGDVSVHKGLATIEGGKSSSMTKVNAAQAETKRTISVGGVHTFALGDLLAALGASPFDLPCDAVESLGAVLGVGNTTGACDKLASAKSVVEQAVGTLKGARDQLLAIKAMILATLEAAKAQNAQAQQSEQQLRSEQKSLTVKRDGLRAQTKGQNRTAVQTTRDATAATCPVLVGDAKAACEAQVASYDATLAAFAQLDVVEARLVEVGDQLANGGGGSGSGAQAISEMEARLDALIATLDAVDPAASAQATCDATTAGLDVLAREIPELAAEAGALKATVVDACNTLTSIFRAVVDQPLISMDGVKIAVNAIAKPKSPTVTVSGTVGQLKIAGLAPIAVNLNVLGPQVQAIEAAVKAKLDEIMTVVGLNVPTPEFEFLITDTKKGQRKDGTWFADGSVTAMRIRMPAVTLSLPVDSPFAVLGDPARLGSGGGGTGLAATFGAALAAVDATVAPAITLDLGKFSAASAFVSGPAKVSGNLNQSGELPFTGIGTVAQAMLGAFFLGGAVLVRRFMSVR